MDGLLLAVSRSLGDKDFKYEIENLIISTPDITYHKINKNEGDKYIMLACDGLYDVFTNEQCMQWLQTNNNFNQNQQENKQYLQTLTNKLGHDAIHVRKSKDNVTLIFTKADT
eukprot:375522_1